MPPDSSPVSSEFVIWVNGEEYKHAAIDPEMTLLQYLRRERGLTGTKLGCAEGGCGACTVVISRRPGDLQPLNACLAPLASLHERHVLTVEGLREQSGQTINGIHRVQREMQSGSQCGFCTPGFVMSLYAQWCKGKGQVLDIEDMFDGNLCRCTGYRPIVDAARRLFSQEENSASQEDTTGKTDCAHDADENSPIQGAVSPCAAATASTNSGATNIANAMPPFPSGLKSRLDNGRLAATFTGPRVKWHRPVSLAQVLSLMAERPLAKLVFGNTEVGIETKFKGQLYHELVFMGDLSELDYIRGERDGDEEEQDVVEIGAGVSLTQLKEYAHKQAKSQPWAAAAHEMLRRFAGNQIRTASSWAGNLVTASPISDLNPLWMALNAQVLVTSREGGDRSVPAADFVRGYRRVDLRPGEIIRALRIRTRHPFREFVQTYKQSKRRDDDIAIVNAALRVCLDEHDRVRECSFVFGGMGPVTRKSSEAAAACIGRHWGEEDLLANTLEVLEREFALPPDAIGGMTEYRLALVLSFFFKFYLYVCHNIGIPLMDTLQSSLEMRKDRELRGEQQYEPGPEGLAVGHPHMHLSGLKHATGEAIFVDDLPLLRGEVYGAPVLSTIAHGLIRAIDMEEARSLPGVMEIITYRDVPAMNRQGPVFHDEFIFVEDRTTSCGQLIALVIAQEHGIAQRAAKLVRITYEEFPRILTIEEAIAKESFYPHGQRTLERGNWQAALADPTARLIQGTVTIGGQDHFYLETHAAQVIPRPEDGEIEINASTQNPNEAQHFVSRALNIPLSRITCRVKRLGGGFGGKETRTSFLIAALAVAAHKLRVPIRCMLDRDEDMSWSGQRHPARMDYKLALTGSGRLLGADLMVYLNGGYSMDLSLGVLERCMTHTDNVYYFPAIRIRGRVCRTNLPSNTAFRGFGGPQGNFLAETMLCHAAQELALSVDQMRTMNMYAGEDQSTPFGMILRDPPILRMWHQLYAEAGIVERRSGIVQFNTANRWRKRGLALVPTKFGIAFGVRHLNQAGALVHLHTDGTVLVAHGGVEMGQGLHTKVCQVAADALGAPLSAVHVSETSTSTVINSSPSAASASSDLYGMAVLHACQELRSRLEPIRARLPREASLAQIAKAAYLERINLSAQGFYITPDVGFDWGSQTGSLYNYFTWGVAASEVEIDVLTGDHSVLRTDILMDLGRPLNPALDIGQIEGAFAQGLGLFTLEQPLFLRSGALLTRGPGAYKLPTARDIPRILRVSLCTGEPPNERAIGGSRAVGEPPLFLAASVLFAIHEAILAARTDALQEGALHQNTPFILPSPATAERIRLACGDVLVRNRNDLTLLDNLAKTAWCFESV